MTKQTGTDDRGQARVWTYRSGAMVGRDMEDGVANILMEAYRAIPRERATAEVLPGSIRQTPTGRWSATVRRVRIEGDE